VLVNLSRHLAAQVDLAVPVLSWDTLGPAGGHNSRLATWNGQALEGNEGLATISLPGLSPPQELRIPPLHVAFVRLGPHT
jgi:hypothetical protein